MSRFACAMILGFSFGYAPNAQQPADEPTYRVQTEVTVTGTVTRVFTHTGQRGTPRSRATLTTSNGVTDIHLGPTSFVSEKNMELARGDEVTVTGSRTAPGMIIVRRLARGDQMLEVRNSAGRPLWEDRHR